MDRIHLAQTRDK